MNRKRSVILIISSLVLGSLTLFGAKMPRVSATSPSLSVTPGWTADGIRPDTHFGLVGMADVNGDGYVDLVVGANIYDDGQTNEGAAYLYYGSRTGLSTSPNWMVESNQEGALFGNTVNTAGDVNGDGYADVIISAPNYDNGEIDEGRVFVYYGSATGLPTTADWIAEGDQAGAHFGGWVNTAGDVNGDGYDDVVIVADGYDNGQTDEGRAYLYYGSVTGLQATSAWTIESDQNNANLHKAGTAGDVNGDGYADIVIGVENYDGDQPDEGRAMLYYGSAGGLSVSPGWIAEGNQANAIFGSSTNTAGDVNHDGYADVIIAAYFYSNDQANEGRAFVYYGSASGLSTSANWTAETDQAGASVGEANTAGDVNGDGYADVAIGSPWYDGAKGKAWVYLGSATGLSSAADWTAQSEQSGAHYGWPLKGGDVNGDGASDLAVGAHAYPNVQRTGKAYLYYGSPSSIFTPTATPTSTPIPTDTPVPPTPAACAPPPAGLVSWWPGDGHANDIQDGNQGTLQGGVTFAPGVVGQAFSFDGMDDEVRVSDAANLDVQNAFTFDAWVNVTEQGVRRTIVWRGDGVVDYGILTDYTGERYSCGIDIGPSEVNAISTTPIMLGTFQHVTCTYDGSLLRLYIDGNVEASASSPVASDINAPLYIGSPAIPGLIDEVEVFNRALSISEIQAIFNAGSAGKCKNTDVTPPVVTVSLPVRNGLNNWFVTSPVIGSVTSADSSTVTAIICTGATVGASTGLDTPNASASLIASTEGISDVTCTATDSTGNSGAGPGSSNTATIKIDTIAPALATNSGMDSCSQPGLPGWCRGAQTAGFSASDATSGVATPCAGASCVFPQSTATNGSAVLIPSGPVCDVAGNCNPGINAGPYMIDSEAPAVIRNPQADACSLPGNAGWCRDIQTAGFNASDVTSGVAGPCVGLSCDFTQSITTNGSAVLISSGPACDVAGNCNPGIDAGPYMIDSVLPTVVRKPEADVCSLPGNAGWCRGTQTAGFSAGDATSGVAGPCAGIACDFTQPNMSDGSAVSIPSGAVCDVAGNCDPGLTAGPYMIDSQAPGISIASPAAGGIYLLNAVVASSYSCSDATSGVATCAGPVVNGENISSNPVGAHTFPVAAADVAGNPAEATHNYKVIYNFGGFFQPVDNLPMLNMVKAGSAVAVNFSLGGNQGLNIFAAGYPVSQPINCDTSAPVDEIEQTVTAGGSSLTYDAASDQYSYVWKTDKAWAGTCRQLTVRLSDGTDHKANFKFK